MTFAVVGEKAFDATDGFLQVVDVGQEDKAEVIGRDPVEAAALHLSLIHI